MLRCPVWDGVRLRAAVLFVAAITSSPLFGLLSEPVGIEENE